MIKRILIACFLCWSSTSHAQHTVSGIISEKDDPSKLISDVSVYLPDFERFDLSKEGGTYILKNVGVGTVVIQFTKAGYLPESFVVSTKDSAYVLNVELTPSTQLLQEPSLVSERLSRVEGIPFSVAKYSNPVIRRSGAILPMAALTTRPGIDRITAGNGVQRAVIRGASGSRVTNYQYGVRIEGQTWDPYQDMDVNDLNLSRAEVVKGPAAIIYGANSSGGVVIWNDAPPPLYETVEGQLDLTYFTNTAGAEADFGVRGAAKSGWFYAFFAGMKSHTSYVQGDTGAVVRNSEDKDFALNSRFSNQSFKATVGRSRSWGISKLTFSRLSQQTGWISVLDPKEYFEPGTLSKEQRMRKPEAPYLDNVSNVVAWENLVQLHGGLLQVNLSYQKQDRATFDSLNSVVDRISALGLSTVTYDAHYATDARASSGLVFGLQGMLQRNLNDGLVALVPDATTNDLGGYLLARKSIRRIEVLAGARIDMRLLGLDAYNGVVLDTARAFKGSLNETYTGFTANGGIIWKATDQLHVRVNAATGFTPPTSYQLTANGLVPGSYHPLNDSVVELYSGNSFIEQGDTELEAEKNLQFDVAVQYENRSVGYTFSAFRNGISNYIFLNNTGSQETIAVQGSRPGIVVDSLLPVYQYDQANASVTGGEFSLDLHPQAVKWIGLTLGYGLVRTDISENNGYAAFQPADKLTAALRLQKDKMSSMTNAYLQVSVSNYAAQKRVANFELPSEAYTLLDLNMGGSLRWGDQMFDLSLAATNLLNTGYTSPLSVLRYQGVREMGRNIMIRFRFPIGFSAPKVVATGS